MFGLGKTPPIDVRAMLADASSDFGGERLSLGCLRFFDDRKAYEAWILEFGNEPLWISDGYEPDKAEIASDILREMLIADKRAVILDWAEGAEHVVDEIDVLLARAGKAKIDEPRREALIALCRGEKRGGAVPKMLQLLDQDVTARGLALHSWDTGGDSYLPHVLTPEARERWRGKSFGKQHPVLP